VRGTVRARIFRSYGLDAGLQGCRGAQYVKARAAQVDD
jgi:hypothetical protein